MLFGHDYEIAVLDEAQAVKNPAAAVSKRIREIRARQRLALTGTPLENNLQELWALYDWLVPGLLGNRKSFTTGFRTPIEKHGDRARQRLLAARLKPFLMRRTKEEVAPELPEKTVIDELVPLEAGQAALYESIRAAMDKRVRDAIAAKGISSSRIAILDALLKLRQVCCDPGLVKLDAARKVAASAKRARLLALLEELVAGGRRVLVFSQFVEMLKLIEGDIAARGWGYAMLHGSTRDRDAQVARFQSGEVPLFLVSLKAGGTGLNLTAADTVIVYDPWWNPAVERQAMDRAHRIGQDKPVFVHRLIAENTVEAAIQRMQARKQALADALFEGAGRGPLGLTDDGYRCAVRVRMTERPAADARTPGKGKVNGTRSGAGRLGQLACHLGAGGHESSNADKWRERCSDFGVCWTSLVREIRVQRLGLCKVRGPFVCLGSRDGSIQYTVCLPCTVLLLSSDRRSV